MKKAYNQPTIEVVRLQAISLMAGSEKVDVQSENYNSQTQTIGAKGGWSWDDSDDDYYEE